MPRPIVVLLLAAVVFLAFLVIDSGALATLGYACALGRCGRPGQAATLAIVLLVAAWPVWLVLRRKSVTRPKRKAVVGRRPTKAISRKAPSRRPRGPARRKSG